MKVLLIHEHGMPHGSGGVIATWRLHLALCDAGVDCVLACRNRKTDRDDVVLLPPGSSFEEFLGKITWRLGLNDIHCLNTFKLVKFEPFRDADVVNIHGWHTNYFNYLALPKLSRAKPIVSTMHDMWPFTGHCAYSYDCEKWKTGCGRCPYPDTFPPIGRDATRIEWKLKSRVYGRSNIAVVAPSRIMVEMAQQSMLERFDIHQIQNSVDTEIYRPLDRDSCRDALGLSRDKNVLMFASVSLTDKVKGGDLLIKAVRNLPDQIKKNTVLLLLGSRSESIIDACGMDAISLGYVTDDQKKTQAFAAADLMVLPSRFENQSLVVIETMSCGTPVVAFDVGGNGEMVQTDRTGYLANAEDADDLRHGIVQLLENESLRADCGSRCRSAIEANHSMPVQAQRYINLYEQVIAGH